MRARLGLLVVAATLLAVWWWWHHSTRAPSTTATAGSAAHERAAHGSTQQADAAGHRIAGTVLLDDKPIAATLRLVGLAGQQRTSADAAGHFAFDHVPAMDYTLIAEQTGATGAMRSLDLRSGQDVEHLTLVLHACDDVVEGVVHDSSGPIAHAFVAESPDGMAAGAGVESGDDGRYRLCVAPTDEGLIARADGYAQATAHLVVSGHTRRDIEMTPEAVIHGHAIRVGDHTPVAGAKIVVSGEATGWGYERLEAVTDAVGAFRVTGMAPGRVLVTATADHLVSTAPVPVIAEVSPPADDVTVEMRSAASVRGVVHEDGAAVSGAHVALVPLGRFPSSGPLRAMTQADGTFEFNAVLPGDYGVMVPTYKQAHDVAVTVAQADVSGLVVDVESPPTVEGRVTYRGAPVEGAVVNGGFETPRTDASGHFKVRAVGPGEVQLYAESKRLGAFTPGPQIVLAPHEHKTGVEIELDRSASIAGTVVDQDGAPVAGVLVRFSLLHGADFGNTSTAQDGTFVATALAGGGSYVYEVRANDGSTTVFRGVERRFAAPIAVRDASTKVTGVRIRVRVDRLSIAGHVTSSSGEPLPDVSVQASDEGMPEGGWYAATAVTDASGAFTLRNLQATTYRVTARSARGVQAQTVAAGRSDVAIVFPEAATIDGELVDFHDATEITMFSRKGDGGFYRPLVTGSHFVFRDVAPGTYKIGVVALDGDADAEVTVAAGGHAAVTLRRVGRGSIAGTLVNPAGAPIAGAECRGDMSAWQTSKTDASGAFRIDHLPAGGTSVSCSTENGFQSARVEVPADGVATVKLVMEPPKPPEKRSAGLTIEYQLGDQIITAVEPGGPGDKAGLRVNDVIVDVDGAQASMFRTYLAEVLDSDPPGKALKLTIERDDKRQTIELVVP